MNMLKRIYHSMPHIHSLKYILALAVAVAIIGFGGGSSVWAHFAYLNRISELHEEIDHYDGEYRRDQAQIRQLMTNPKSMERIAREQYFMKMADEDIFVLSDDEQKSPTKASADEKIE